MSFKEISYPEFWQPLCSLELKHLCNFARRHHKEQLGEIVLNLDQWFRREMAFDNFSYLELWRRSGTICAILIRGYPEEQIL